MALLDLLHAQAVQRGLIEPAQTLDAPAVFNLVREMPYRRAADRQPETIISAWQGTCSGKHYLLQALFGELGLSAQVMACTTSEPIDAAKIPPELFPLYEAANRRFVDVHNYIVLDWPGLGPMLVDATWPLESAGRGMRVNPALIPGQDQLIALDPLQSWPIPAGRDPQAFKQELLQAHFSPAELQFREVILAALMRQ